MDTIQSHIDPLGSLIAVSALGIPLDPQPVNLPFTSVQHSPHYHPPGAQNHNQRLVWAEKDTLFRTGHGHLPPRLQDYNGLKSLQTLASVMATGKSNTGNCGLVHNQVF